jgi:hypothetical protein
VHHIVQCPCVHLYIHHKLSSEVHHHCATCLERWLCVCLLLQAAYTLRGAYVWHCSPEDKHHAACMQSVRVMVTNMTMLHTAARTCPHAVHR